METLINDIIIANIAYRLRLRRIMLCLTQTEVEVALKMKYSSLSRIESGCHQFKMFTVVPLIYFYGLRLTDVVQDYKEKPSYRDWKRLELMEDRLLAAKKSKGRMKVRRAVQLSLW